MVRVGAIVNLLLLLLLCDGAFGALPALLTPYQGQLHSALKPNVRESLDDCHLRYYHLGSDGFVAPAAGRPAYLREFAHLGAIGWKQPDGSIKWGCGGSLIWENFLLTAAHCAADENNVMPSVVRFGDLNLYNETDDSFAQQYNIREIIRHPEHKFSAKYHDIALIMLEKSVSLNETVAPACLWDEEEMRFPVLESAGWGATGVGQSQTPILLKVSLRPVEKSQCDEHYRAGHRGLKQGLQDYHVCAGDAKMDTCPGDSGGPLQVKLLHNVRVTPFIVAVTSFGSFCGQSVPGVYVKVAPYISWIRSVLAKYDEEFNGMHLKPYGCAVKYFQLREYEPDVVYSKSATTENLNYQGIHITVESTPSTVRIVWNGSETPASMNCHGVLIDEDTVVTLAQCAASNGELPTEVIAKNVFRQDVATVHVHPKYVPGTMYNNIAVLKLNKSFVFFDTFQPSCPWYYPDVPPDEVEVAGRGRTDLNRLVLNEDEEITIDPRLTTLVSRASQRSAVNCTLAKEYETLLNRGLLDEHLCFGNDLFLVPGACQLQKGGTIQRNVFRYSKYFPHVYALNLLGKDCGYGEPALGVKLASHFEWLRQILLPRRALHDDSVQFFNTDLELHDHCKLPDGEYGMCTNMHQCPKVRYEFSVNRRVTLCSNGTIVCCPFQHVLNGTEEESTNELDECSSRYRTVHNQDIFEPYEELDFDQRIPHVVMVAWKTKNETIDYCLATLITQSVALSAASCLKIEGDLVVVKLGWEVTAPTLRVKKITLHPEYEESTRRNDIAIVKIAGIVDPTTGKVPACVWQNSTHTPFHLHQFVLLEEQYQNSYPKYNTDCEQYQHYGNRSLDATQLCADLESTFMPIKSGEPAFWQQRLDENGTVVHYLVGIVSYVFPSMTTQTRIEPYVDWIKRNL